MEGEVALDDPCEGGSADGPGCSSDADDGGDGGGGEHIAGGGEEIGGPALVGGGGEGDEKCCGPGVRGEEGAHVRDEYDGEDTEGHEEHGEFASMVDGHAAMHESAGEGASQDGAYGRDEIDGDDVPVSGFEAEAVVAIEELREIEEIEPPDAVGEAFAYGEGPEAAAAEDGGEGEGSAADAVGGEVGFEVGLGLGGGSAEAVVGEEEPDDEPDHAHGSGGEEGCLPAVACSDEGYEGGRDEGGSVGAGVEEADGLGALAGREPLADGLDGGGEVSGFAEAEKDAGDAEACDGAYEGVAHGGDAPDEDGDGVAGLGAELVNHAAGEEEAESVSDLEEDDDVAEVVVEDGLVELVGEVVPAHEGDFVEQGFDVAEDVAIHVIDGGGEEEEEADDPARVGSGSGRGVGGREAGGLIRHACDAPAAELV